MSSFDVEIVGKTDVGKVRKRNEDSMGMLPELGLIVVADGMGGHKSGEVASSLAIETILTFAKKMLGGSQQIVPEGDAGVSPRSRQLSHFLTSANTIIWEKSRAFPKDHGMGTTVVAALVDGNTITVAHVGDSRLYVYRKGALERLTEDHSLVMDQVKHGLISEEEAEKSNLQNILTRALGTEENVKVDVQDHPIFPGDQFLLCSDGLTKMVTDKEMAEVLGRGLSPEKVVDTFIEMALEGGGVDNTTVGIVRVGEEKRGLFSQVISTLLGRG